MTPLVLFTEKNRSNLITVELYPGHVISADPEDSHLGLPMALLPYAQLNEIVPVLGNWSSKDSCPTATGWEDALPPKALRATPGWCSQCPEMLRAGEGGESLGSCQQ